MHTKEIVDEFNRSTTGISCHDNKRVAIIPLSFIPEPPSIIVQLIAMVKRELIKELLK